MKLIDVFKKRRVPRADAVVIYDTRHGPMAQFGADQCIGRSLEIYGEWAQDEIALLRHFISKGSTIIDLGANIGVHTLAFARLVGSNGRVIAVEGEPATFSLLSYNVIVNQLTGAVTAVPALVGATEGLVPHCFRPPSDNVGAMSFSGQVHGGHTVGGEAFLTTKLPLITVDSLRLDACDVMKIDIEGMELDALRGSSDTLRKYSPVIYFEHASNNQFVLSEIFELLRSYNYKMWWHVSNPFNRRNKKKEKKNIFGGLVEINVLALPDTMKPPTPLLPLTDPTQPPPRPSLEGGLPGVSVD